LSTWLFQAAGHSFLAGVEEAHRVAKASVPLDARLALEDPELSLLVVCAEQIPDGSTVGPRGELLVVLLRL
jgi:hypothetical protein